MIKFAQILQTAAGQWYLQVAKCYGLKYRDVRWMACDTLGEHCLTPDIDLEESLIPCDSETDAMQKLAEHYASQLPKMSMYKASKTILDATDKIIADTKINLITPGI